MRRLLFKRSSQLVARRWYADSEPAGKPSPPFPMHRPAPSTPKRNYMPPHVAASLNMELPGTPVGAVDVIADQQARGPFVKLDTADKSTLPMKQEQEVMISFDEMPGPKLLRQISKMWTFVPMIGNQLTTTSLQYVLSAGKIFGSQLSWGNNMILFKYLLNEYGPVVRLHGPFGGDVVILSRPEHASIVFQNEGPFPIRSSLDCVEKYRLEHRMYKQAGPFVMHGPQWEALRKSIEPALEKSLDSKLEKITKASEDFVGRILMIRNRQEEVPSTFKDEITKWSMECLFMIMFNKQVGFLDSRGTSTSSEAGILLNSLNDATDAIRKCEFGLHLWKFIQTPAWKKLVIHCDIIDHILGNYLRKAQDILRDSRQQAGSQNTLLKENVSLVDYFLMKDTLIAEDILTILLDMMLLGVNMTTHTVGFLLFHLAKHPRAQYNLYKEIKELPEAVTKEDLKKMVYMHACLRESLRLKPPMPVLSRILTKDITVDGYQIPKGTYMLIATNLSSLREEHFEDPLKFKPERWIGAEANKDLEALATIPFGRGPKACLARELAETQICLLMVKILKKFRVEYHYGDIESNNKLLAAPSRPFKLRLLERK